MKLTTRTEKGRMGGYIGRVVCLMHDGRRLWSETSGVERVSRADAKEDAKWLLEQHRRLNTTPEI